MSLAKLWAMYTSLEQGRKEGPQVGWSVRLLVTMGEYHASGWRGRGVSIALWDTEIRRRRSGPFTVHLRRLGGRGNTLFALRWMIFFPPLEVWEWLFRHFGSMSERERRGEVYTIQRSNRCCCVFGNTRIIILYHHDLFCYHRYISQWPWESVRVMMECCSW